LHRHECDNRAKTGVGWEQRLRRGSIRYDGATLDGLPSRSSRRQPAYARWASAWQPSLAARAKAGGGRRTRTFEVVRRLIYSQLPLPLGTLPRPTTSQAKPLGGGGQAMDDVNTVSRWRAPGRPRLWAKGGGKVNQGKPLKTALETPKLPYSPPRDTSSS
jgi:hypothetical protein